MKNVQFDARRLFSLPSTAGDAALWPHAARFTWHNGWCCSSGQGANRNMEQLRCLYSTGQGNKRLWEEKVWVMASIKKAQFWFLACCFQVRGQSGDSRGGLGNRRPPGGLACPRGANKNNNKKKKPSHSDPHPARLFRSRFHFHIHQRTFSQSHNQKASNLTAVIIAHLVSERSHFPGGIRYNTTSSLRAQGHLAQMAKFSASHLLSPVFPLRLCCGPRTGIWTKTCASCASLKLEELFQGFQQRATVICSTILRCYFFSSSK